MHRHGWIPAFTLAAICACAGQTAPARETGDASPTPGPTSNDGGRVSNGDGGRVPSQHRSVAAACSEPAPPGNCHLPKSTVPGSCQTDSDCADGSLSGRCIEPTLGGPALCDCTYDRCTVDADCGSGHACSCRIDPYQYGFGNTCVPGNCRIDSDCGVGGYCSPSVGPNSFNIGGYYCHTARDECIDDRDCAMGYSDSFCFYSTGDGRWECETLPAPG
jgi:hypothetical protein